MTTKRPGPARKYPAAPKVKRGKIPPRYARSKETAEQRQARMDRGSQMAEGFAQAIGDFINHIFFGGHPQRPQASRPATELEAELLREGYKKLALKYHPDKGGDPEKMRELNSLKEKLGL